ncbi:VOC family protein [Pseudonocardia sp.]|jgi:predicted enzyme related to lactoylglutathione lyase|uniref:VOC family protein n=1 Tax=Pseudonocardia sp. TaxID=60912 RepID=UPI002621D594|nr:VOC family protein [Pseudonocardia sp.]
MSNSVIGLSIDCADAAKLAHFWADVLGRQVNSQPTAEFAAIDANDSTQGPRLAFHQVPEAKTVKNRLHLDLISSDFASETNRLLSLGATRVNDVEQGRARWATFLDPEGNEFDLVAA